MDSRILTAMTALLLGAALAAAPVPFGPADAPWLGGAALADDDDGGGGDDDDDDGGGDDDDDGGGGAGGGGASGGGGSSGAGGSSESSSGGSRGDGGGGNSALPRGDGNDPVSRWLRRTFGGADPTPPPRAARAPRAPQTAPRPAPRPDFAEAVPDEIVVFDLAPADLASLIAQGFTARETTPLGGIGVTLHRLGIAPGLDLDTARAQVAALPTGGGADFNHFYRPETGQSPSGAATSGPVRSGPAPCRGEGCTALRLVNWTAPAACTAVVRVGMIDTPVNAEHPALAGTPIATLRTAATDSPPASPAHGTAVAALLVGDPGTGLAGLLPGTALIAVDAFHMAGRDERADVAALLRGLSELAEAQVNVVNLSIAGPHNALLEDAVARLTARGMVLAAAAGNAGPGAPPAYPGAYGPVIAVTAVDADARIYRRAQDGDHVDLAAPGVDVWTAASISGLRPKTGTSFAVPFVTAALARLKADAPDLMADDLRARLAATARDLGTPGRDPVFGDGLLSAAGLCDSDAHIWTASGSDDDPAASSSDKNPGRPE